MKSDALPSRRDEDWRWSDLRAAAAGRDLALAEGDDHVIARLAKPQGRGVRIDVAADERRVIFDDLTADDMRADAIDAEVAAGGELSRIVVQSGDGAPLSLMRVRLSAGAVFRQFVLARGGRLARIETLVQLAEEGARADLDAVYLVGAGRHADLTTRVVHEAPNTSSGQIIRGGARRGGRAVFQGRIDVAAHAAGVDARQSHAGLLLDHGAEILSKPELRILCDDVQCAHGNTVGALDPEALFYLRQRGLPEPVARIRLTEAFLIGAMPGWIDDETRERLTAMLETWLEQAS